MNQMVARPPLAAVIFDLDDTLHDDTVAYQRAAERVAQEIAGEGGIEARAPLGAYIAEVQLFWENLSREQLTESIGGVRTAMWRAALRAVGVDDPALAERCAT